MDDEYYELHEDGRGIRVFTKDGKIVWEVSACCLIADKVADVNNEPVGVTNGLLLATPIPDSKRCFLCMALWLLLYTIGTCFNDYEREDMLPYFRMWNMGCVGFFFGMFVGSIAWGACAVGINNYTARHVVEHAFFLGAVSMGLTIMPLGSSTLTSFVGCCVSCTCGICVLLPWHWYNVAREDFVRQPTEKAPEIFTIFGLRFAWPRYWKWCTAQISLTFGTWIIMYVIGVVYVLVNIAGFGRTANALLPIVVTGLESTLILVLQTAHGAFIFKTKACGDQMYAVMLAACFIHGFTESVKLTATVSGAAFCEDNPNGLTWPNEGSCDPYGWLLSLGAGLVTTLLGRFGWTRYLQVRLLRLFKFVNVAKGVAPSIITKMHDEAKFNIGYVRFIIPLTILFANLLTGKTVVVFNMPATWCVIASFLLEFVEDLIVGYEVLPYPPSPNPTTYMAYDNYDPRQLYTFVTSPEEELVSRKSGRSSRINGGSTCEMSNSKSFTSKLARLQADGDFFPRALALHGCRNMTVFEQVGLIGICVFFSTCLLQLLLGAGYVAGVCEQPLSVEDRFKEVLVWPLPLNKCMYG